MLVYVSHPIGKVVGEFLIDGIISERLDKLRNETKEGAGISEETYLRYFIGKGTGYAPRIGKAKKYREPLCIKEHLGVSPPQSSVYLD